MKRKFLLFLVVLSLIVFVPQTQNYAMALEESVGDYQDDFEGYVLVSENTKYYKTVTTYDLGSVFSASSFSGLASSVSYEISEEEYNAATNENSLILGNPTTVETTYQTMTSSIYTNGSYYRYKNNMSWRFIPDVRSYDIIGIGFLSTVQPVNGLSFKQDYCYTSGGCGTATLRTPQFFTNGAGASFKLVEGNLSSLSATLYFDVTKANSGSTVSLQMAYADYAHAITTTSLVSSTYYQVIQSAGIVLNSSISSSYNSIDVADASWYGTW